MLCGSVPRVLPLACFTELSDTDVALANQLLLFRAFGRTACAGDDHSKTARPCFALNECLP